MELDKWYSFVIHIDNQGTKTLYIDGKKKKIIKPKKLIQQHGQI
jgi:hypothetical protein